jgi:hypothetical protein
MRNAGSKMSSLRSRQSPISANPWEDYERLVDRFGVRRSNEGFWLVYDAINSAHLASDPVQSGTHVETTDIDILPQVQS